MGARWKAGGKRTLPQDERDLRVRLAYHVLEILRAEVTPEALAHYGGPSAAKLAAIYNSASDLGLVAELDERRVR